MALIFYQLPQRELRLALCPSCLMQPSCFYFEVNIRPSSEVSLLHPRISDQVYRDISPSWKIMPGVMVYGTPSAVTSGGWSTSGRDNITAVADEMKTAIYISNLWSINNEGPKSPGPTGKKSPGSLALGCPMIVSIPMG